MRLRRSAAFLAMTNAVMGELENAYARDGQACGMETDVFGKILPVWGGRRRPCMDEYVGRWDQWRLSCDC
jgi:hypothetical protein